jgi:hypothetical protein
MGFAFFCLFFYFTHGVLEPSHESSQGGVLVSTVSSPLVFTPSGGCVTSEGMSTPCLVCDGVRCNPERHPSRVVCVNVVSPIRLVWTCECDPMPSWKSSYTFVFRNVSCTPAGPPPKVEEDGGELSDNSAAAQSCILFYSIGYNADICLKVGFFFIILTVLLFMIISFCPQKELLNSGGTYDSPVSRAPTTSERSSGRFIYRVRSQRRPVVVPTFPIDEPSY